MLIKKEKEGSWICIARHCEKLAPRQDYRLYAHSAARAGIVFTQDRQAMIFRHVRAGEMLQLGLLAPPCQFSPCSVRDWGYTTSKPWKLRILPIYNCSYIRDRSLVRFHRRNLPYEGYRYPHFLDSGVQYPHFSGRKGEEFAVNKGDLRRLNYNKTIFGRGSAPDPAGRAQCSQSSRTQESDEDGILPPHLDHSPPFSAQDPWAPRSPSELVPLTF